jgi:hypothetical protein
VVVVAVGLIVLIVMQWLVLHAPGGHEVSVNAKRINSMREGEGGEKNVLLTGEVRCVISMDDGKLVNVVETCAEVRDAIKELEKQDE